MSLSQRALGLLFTPPVTTQFISNVERGVTPLPPAHVPTLAKALNIPETEIMSLLEKEYSKKLNDRFGLASGNGTVDSAPGLTIAPGDLTFMQSLYTAYQLADPKTREEFARTCESMLNIQLHASRKSG